MSLNQIELKPQILAALYERTLLETNASAPIPQPAAPSSYLGKNGRQILVVVTHPHTPVLPDEELSFLTNILAACKLSLADIGIVNFHQSGQEGLQQLIDTEARQVLLFGIDPLAIGLPINFPFFQLQQFSQRTYLYAPALAQIESDKQLKLQLWNSLKKLFGI